MTGTVVPNAALAATWARAHLLDLEDDLDAGLGDRAGLTQHIIDTSLRFHVLCRFTAYMAVDHAGTIDATGRSRRVIQPVDLPAGWDPSAVGLARRQASPVAFRVGTNPGPRPGSRAPAGPVTTKERVPRHVSDLLRQLDQRAASLAPRTDRLRRLHTLMAQLKIVGGRARTAGFSDTDLSLVDALLKRLERLLSPAEAIRQLDNALHRCAVDLRTRTTSATPGPSTGRSRAQLEASSSLTRSIEAASS